MTNTSSQYPSVTWDCCTASNLLSGEPHSMSLSIFEASTISPAQFTRASIPTDQAIFKWMKTIGCGNQSAKMSWEPAG